MNVLHLARKMFIRFVSIKKYIIFESVPTFSDNTRAVFEEMIARKMNHNYKMIWLQSKEGEDIPKIFNCHLIKKRHKILRQYYLNSAKCIICCNSTIGSHREGQYSIYLSHATTVKRIKDYYTLPPNITKIITASEGVKPFVVDQFNYDIDRAVATGFPRNDILCKKSTINLNAVFDNKASKFIVWYPTFRQGRRLNTDSKHAIPIVHDENAANRINNFARDNNLLIIIKPHFNQNLKYLNELNLSNIIMIDDYFFVKHSITSYEFVGACDALITDYSSIYFDFLLCDKPVASVQEDLAEYINNPGVVKEAMELIDKGAIIVNTEEDFISFLQDIVDNIDRKRTTRRKVMEFCNYSSDGNSAKRVTDLIVRDAQL